MIQYPIYSIIITKISLYFGWIKVISLNVSTIHNLTSILLKSNTFEIVTKILINAETGIPNCLPRIQVKANVKYINFMIKYPEQYLDNLNNTELLKVFIYWGIYIWLWLEKLFNIVSNLESLSSF